MGLRCVAAPIPPSPPHIRPTGLVELPRQVFYLWTTLGTALWTGGLDLAGHALEDQFALVEDWAGPIGFGIMAVVIGGIGLHLWRARGAP